MTRAPRQEQEPATDEITEVGPGVLRLQLPVSLPGLGHVNCYSLEDGEGFAVVDPGLPGEVAWRDLLGRFALAGIPLQRVHTVVVTHSHLDHFGGAARLRQETGAEIVTHEAFRLWWNPTAPDGEDPEAIAELAPASGVDRPTRWGGKNFVRDHDESIDDEITGLRSPLGTPRPTKRLADADVITLAGRDWVAMHTPGHTQDHLCLYDPEEGIVMSGDHVLPTITPHIGGTGDSSDPLDEFLESLHRMTLLEGVTNVLPAHGHPFTNLHHRVERIKEHHLERLQRLRTAARAIGRPAPVEELTKQLFSEAAWGPMADSETYVHLEYLRRAGLARSIWKDDLLHYAVTD
jgi:glyoxylase-like metal-dependent hydrolase (beta-lactamase superfamily II)